MSGIRVRCPRSLSHRLLTAHFPWLCAVAFGLVVTWDVSAADGLGGTGRMALMSPQFNPIAVQGAFVFVANTPNNTVDVIDTTSRTVIRQIPVGIEPVGLAIRPDGSELWVANHVSDSISVIDLQTSGPTCFCVTATLQDLDPLTLRDSF